HRDGQLFEPFRWIALGQWDNFPLAPFANRPIGFSQPLSLFRHQNFLLHKWWCVVRQNWRHKKILRRSEYRNQPVRQWDIIFRRDGLDTFQRKNPSALGHREWK